MFLGQSRAALASAERALSALRNTHRQGGRPGGAIELLEAIVLAVQMKDSSWLGITLNADKAWNSLVKKVRGTIMIWSRLCYT